MRTKDCDWVVRDALEALFSQNFQDFELLVVDSGSTDETLSIVSDYPCRLIEIQASDYFPGKVLNQAIATISSPIVVFQNSDTIPQHPEALGNLVGPFENPEVMGAFGRQIPRPEAWTWVRRDYAQAFPAEGPAPDWLPFSLPFAALRRSLWEERPFYTEAWGSEDTEWGHWAKEAGHEIRYVPEATVMHSHNYTLRQIYGRRFIEGEADAFIYGRRDPLTRMAWRALRGSARDSLAHLKAFDVPGLVKTPVRLAVDSWAYHRGHRHGENRIVEKDDDAGTGQRTVLERYG